MQFNRIEPRPFNATMIIESITGGIALNAIYIEEGILYAKERGDANLAMDSLQWTSEFHRAWIEMIKETNCSYKIILDNGELFYRVRNHMKAQCYKETKLLMDIGKRGEDIPNG